MIQLALLSLLLVASAPVEKGSLRLTSLPGVVVEWEGIALGETGGDGVLWIRDIPPGDYTLTLSKPGYRPSTSRLTIAGGETAVSLGLERLPPPRAAPRRRPAAPPLPQPPAPEPENESPGQAEAAGGAPVSEPVPREPAAPPVAVAEPVPASRTAAADSSSGTPGPLLPLLLLALVLAAALALVVDRTVRLRAASKKRKPSPRRPNRKPVSAAPPPSDEPPGFLRDLQRREEYVDSPAPEIIEVTDVEILDEEP